METVAEASRVKMATPVGWWAEVAVMVAVATAREAMADVVVMAVVSVRNPSDRKYNHVLVLRIRLRAGR